MFGQKKKLYFFVFTNKFNLNPIRFVNRSVGIEKLSKLSHRLSAHMDS